MQTDVKLMVGGQKIKAHRMILGSRSTYLRKLLYPINGNEVTLDDCDYKATFTAIRFIYTNQCVTEPENLAKVLLVGKKFALKDLLISCFELLNPGNVALFPATIHYLREDKNRRKNQHKTNFCDDFWKYVEKNMSSTLSSEEFWSLTHEEIMSFLKRPEVKPKVNFSELQSKLAKKKEETLEKKKEATSKKTKGATSQTS